MKSRHQGFSLSKTEKDFVHVWRSLGKIPKKKSVRKGGGSIKTKGLEEKKITDPKGRRPRSRLQELVAGSGGRE